MSVVHATASLAAESGSPAGRYVHWGVVQISVTNLVIIGVMILLFVLALLLPFPAPREDRGEP